MATHTTAEPSAETTQREIAPARRRSGWWIDALIFVVLVAAAVPNRIAATKGDLWVDEADYCFAALRGFNANRWDAAPSGAHSITLVRLRHYHPPFTVDATSIGLRRGATELDVRLPSVAAGALAVGLLYLCGLALLRRYTRRDSEPDRPPVPMAFVRLAAAACAFIVIVTPPCVRAASHALPWSFVTMWLVALLWPLLEWCDSQRIVWLAVAGAALGGLFVTSEEFFVALLGLAVSVPFLVAAGRGVGWKRATIGTLGFFAGFALVVWAVWPIGILGDAVANLRHYVNMSGETFPVDILGRTYARAPKWAYAFWYLGLYPPHFILYALGFCTAVLLALRRRLSYGAYTLMTMMLVLLAAAHRAHIIGPEYLAHVLPFLTLPAALSFVVLYRRRPARAIAVVGLFCLVCALYPPIKDLSGMDPLEQQPRWPLAAQAIKAQWRPGDRMLAGQLGTVGRWYLVHVVKAQATDRSVQILPIRSDPVRPAALQAIAHGAYRFIAVGSSLEGTPNVNAGVGRLIAHWPVLWRSAEPDGGLSRLTVYEYPESTGDLQRDKKNRATAKGEQRRSPAGRKV